MKASTVAIVILALAAAFLGLILWRRAQAADDVAPKSPATAMWEAFGSLGGKALDIWGPRNSA